MAVLLHPAWKRGPFRRNGSLAPWCPPQPCSALLPKTSRFVTSTAARRNNVTWKVPSASSRRLQEQAFPRNIILVRHGESLGNQDETMYSTTPDWKIPLSRKGRIQAQHAGKQIQSMIGDDHSPVVVYVSPYLRTKQTAEEILAVLKNPVFYIREEPRLREQDFGNFQDPDEIRKAKTDRPKFGRFFFRFPSGGESGADVFDRVSAFSGTFLRDMDQLGAEQARQATTILVTHGITSRLFVMKWFHWSVDDFEALHNLPNCGLLHLTRTSDGNYRLTEESRRLVNGPLPHDDTGVGRAMQLGSVLKERRRQGLVLTKQDRDAFDLLPESGAWGL